MRSANTRYDLRLETTVFALLLGACVSTTGVVRSRFATEQNCAEDQVTVDQTGAEQYRARGCGQETTYVCGSVAALKGGVQCVQQGLSGPPGYREPERSVLPPPDPRIPPSP
jgi:hypothetical protein